MVQDKLMENEFAAENEDYFINSSLGTSLTGRGNTQDFKLTAHFAKKLSTKGSGARAEEAEIEAVQKRRNYLWDINMIIVDANQRME